MATLTGYLRDREGVYIDKDPEAELDYSLDWSEYTSGSDTIATATWSIEPISGDSDPLTTGASSITSDITTVVISGGTAGNIYTVRCLVTTTEGNTDRRSFRISVKNRSL